MSSPEEPLDFQVDINGIILTPQNTLVHLFQPRCWSIIEIEQPNGLTEDEIVEDDVIVSLIRGGFPMRDNGPPSESYRQWYVYAATQNLDAELTSFYDELGGV